MGALGLGGTQLRSSRGTSSSAFRTREYPEPSCFLNARDSLSGWPNLEKSGPRGSPYPYHLQPSKLLGPLSLRNPGV